MSIETQAILSGHIAVERIASLLSSETGDKVAVCSMQRAQYKILDVQHPDGGSTALHVFLESWAADDYVDAYQGASTFVTAEYSPRNFDILRTLTAVTGGLTRRTTAEPWTALERVA